MIRLSHLLRDRSGVAMTEFALAAPFLLGFGLWGIETANLALTHLAVSQLAAHVADNGSRIGDTSTLEDRKIYESDINDLLYGASVQAGNKLELFKHGRVIISSLEVDPTSGDQYIHWQRCKGVKAHPSSYGLEGEKLPEAGMGPAGHEVIAQPDDAVIFVEIAFDYQSLVSDSFVGETEITATAAFTVRDDRDLSQIYQRDTADPDPIAACNVFDTTSTRLT